ncbi:MAG: PKD domain-containing protein [Chromatiaceae bacterium]|nr:PKD domain-containing protein [Chromatiaceae bacterium]
MGSKAGTNPYRASPRPENPAIYDSSAHGQKWQVLDVAKVYPRGTRQGVYANLYYLSGINDAGYAVGRKSRYGLVGSAAFLTTPSFQDVTFLPIPSGGSAVAINNFNQVVGTNGESHAYLYNQVTGVYTKLDTLNEFLRSSAADVNDFGQVVGNVWLSPVDTSLYDPTLYHAFIWEDPTSGIVDLNDLSGAPNWLLTAATAINDKGDIVGTGIMGGEVHGFLLSNDPSQLPGSNQRPVAAAEADVTSGRAPLTVTFSAAGSADPDGDALSFEWDFGDGTTGSGTAPTHTYTDPGTYLAIVTASDGRVTDTASVEIKVRKGRRSK